MPIFSQMPQRQASMADPRGSPLFGGAVFAAIAQFVVVPESRSTVEVLICPRRSREARSGNVPQAQGVGWAIWPARMRAFSLGLPSTWGTRSAV